MLELIDSHIEKMLTLYTQGEYFERLKQAKETYIGLTGKLDEDKDEFIKLFFEPFCFGWFEILLLLMLLLLLILLFTLLMLLC